MRRRRITLAPPEFRLRPPPTATILAGHTRDFGGGRTLESWNRRRMLTFDKHGGNCLPDCPVTHALSGLCVGLVLTNAAGKVVWLNSAAQRILGRPHDACLGRSLERLLRDLGLVAFWKRAAAADGNVLGDVAVTWPESLNLKLNATRYVDARGRVRGRALLFCDVTAERSVQVQLSHEVADRLLRMADAGATPSSLQHLTPQELRVLGLLGQGVGNDQIAAQLHVSASTVRSHLKSVYRKLGLKSRAEAVSYAARCRLAEPSSQKGRKTPSGDDCPARRP